MLLVRFGYLAKKRLWVNVAEDIAQEACLTVYEKYTAIPENVLFEAWAYQVLRNKIGNFIQKLESENKLLSEINKTGSNHSETETEIALKIDLERCLRKMAVENKRYHEILILARDGFKTDEICEKLNIKTGNMYVILERSRAKLKKCLKIGKPYE